MIKNVRLYIIKKKTKALIGKKGTKAQMKYIKNSKRNERGISVVLLILIILIVFICFIIYTSLTGENESQVNISYENYYDEEYLETENEAIRYYYNQLEEPAKIMYTTILENIEKLKSGIETIEFPSSVSDSIKKIGGSEENNYFQSAWDAVALDNLNLFYVDTNNLSIATKTTSLLGYKSYEFTLEPQSGKTYYNSFFTNAEQINQAINEIEQITNEIVANATGSRYDKILYVHDWIVDNVEYDNDNTINNDNIYGTFVNKKVVCEGYAEALKYLLDKLNIPCVLVYGNGYDDEGNVEAHAWNYVKMEDGNWYAIDTTWDDPLYIGGSNSITQNLYKHTYFLKGSKSFNRNHVSDGDVSGTGQDFKYPELSENDYN